MLDISGNFDVLRGGTFYDRDVYYYSDQNQRPNPNVDGGDNILYNFRDFADIKNDLYQYRWKIKQCSAEI